MEKDDAAEKRTAQLLDQYKAYVADVGNIGARQAQTNTWYVSILSALLVFLGLTSTAGALKDFDMAVRAAVALLAILICGMWRVHARSFGLLYKAKFDVLREMEAMLPFACYTREWELLQNSRYSFFTAIEGRITRAIMIPFVLLFALAVARIIIDWLR